MNEEEPQQQQHIKQEEELFIGLPQDTIERVLVGYLVGTRFIFYQKYEIAIGCLTTSIGLVPLPYLYRLRAIAFLNHDLWNKCLHDCDYYCNYHKNREGEAHERFMMDGLIVRAHANVLLENYEDANKDLQQLVEISDKYESIIKQQEDSYYYDEEQDDIINKSFNGDEEEEEEMNIVDALKTLCVISERLVAISQLPEKQQETEQISVEKQLLISKLCLYCDEYEKMIVNLELEWIDSHHAGTLDSLDLDIPLSISDIVTLASSQDANARSMGAVLLCDKFEEISLTNSTELLQAVVESGGLAAIIDSLLHWKDSELVFFATKAISDLCWSGSTEIRWKIAESNVIPKLIEQFNSDDADLAGVSVAAIALLGRGGSGIDRIIREHGGIRALLRLLSQDKIDDRDQAYIVQSLSWLSGDIDNKIEIIEDARVPETLSRFARESSNQMAKHCAIITLGNVCQNPEIWGRADLYDHVNTLVQKLIDDGLVNYLIKKVTTPLSDSSTSEANEMRISSIVTLTHLVGFKIIRDQLEPWGGEGVFYELLYSSSDSVLSDVLTKAIRFYRTLQDYGDHMADALLPRYRLTLQTTNEIESVHSSISSVLKATLEYQNAGLFGLVDHGALLEQEMMEEQLRLSEQMMLEEQIEMNEHVQFEDESAPSEQVLTNELLKILDMKIMKDKKPEAVKQQQKLGKSGKSGKSTEKISNLVTGLFDVASYVWNGEGEDQKPPSKTKLKNQKKKLKKAANKKAARMEQQKKQVDEVPNKKPLTTETKSQNQPTKPPQNTATSPKPEVSVTIRSNKEQKVAVSTVQTNNVQEATVGDESTTANKEVAVSQRDPYMTFLREFETGMNMLARSLEWGC